MKDRKININRPVITAGEIESFKDFGSLVNRYESASRFRYYKFGVMGLAVAAVALIVILTVWRTPAGDPSVAFVNPPMKGIDIGYSSYKVDAAQGAELTYKTGSKIKIPQDAFLDKNGKVVTGNVDVKYREFHDPVDFFVSGIPMTYDSAGTTYHFESAGMMELTAYRGSEPLIANPESKIEVSMASRQAGNEYNLYYLDTVKKLWVHKGKDKIAECEPQQMIDSVASNQPIPAANEAGDTSLVYPDYLRAFGYDDKMATIGSELDKVKAELKSVEDAKPFKPKKATLNGRKFNIDVDPKEFPELALYKGMYFEVGEENKNFDAKLYNVTWEDAQLTENVKGVNYQLTLSKGKEKHDLIVYPVYEGEDYDKALKLYGNKFSEYQSTLAEKKAEEKRKLEEYQAKVKKLEEERQAQMKKIQEEQEARMKAWAEQQKTWAEQQREIDEAFAMTQISGGAKDQGILRVFTISNFGFWNCDRPQIMPREKVLAARFADAEGNELKFGYVYLAEKGRNAIFTYAPNFNSLGFNPKKENWLWGVAGGNRLAVFMPEDFRNIPAGKASHTFVMNVVERKFNSVEEVREFLGLENNKSAQVL